MNYYIETPKECPKCHQRKLFFCTIIEKISDHEFTGTLGVRCHNTSCNYQAKLKRERE